MVHDDVLGEDLSVDRGLLTDDDRGCCQVDEKIAQLWLDGGLPSSLLGGTRHLLFARRILIVP